MRMERSAVRLGAAAGAADSNGTAKHLAATIWKAVEEQQRCANEHRHADELRTLASFGAH